MSAYERKEETRKFENKLKEEDMKKFIVLMICVVFILSLSLYGCGNNKVINGVEYGTYGLLNSDDKKNPDIQYEVIWGNVFWGAFLAETIIAPIYFFGFSLWEPVGPRSPIKGQVVK
jgi:hypothetical protein